MSPPGTPPPNLFTLTADQDPTPELARAHLWAARDRSLREETLCWLAARVLRAAEIRAQVHARARDLGARTDAALWRLGDPAVLEEVEALALALALGDFDRRLARAALEVGSGAATELTRELLERLAALGEAALEGADLRMLAAWWAEGALQRHAACLAVAEEPPALFSLASTTRTPPLRPPRCPATSASSSGPR